MGRECGTHMSVDFFACHNLRDGSLKLFWYSSDKESMVFCSLNRIVVFAGALFLSANGLTIAALAKESPYTPETANYCWGFSKQAISKRENEELKFLASNTNLHRKLAVMKPAADALRKTLAEFQSERRRLCDLVAAAGKRATQASQKSIAGTKVIDGEAAYRKAQEEVVKAHLNLTELSQELHRSAIKMKDLDQENSEIHRKLINKAEGDKAIKKTDVKALFKEMNVVWESRIPGTLFKPLVEGPLKEKNELTGTLGVLESRFGELEALIKGNVTQIQK